MPLISIELPPESLARLSRAREAAEMSQGELAKLLDMSRTHFALCELGRRQASPELIVRWADALGLEAEIVPATVKFRRKKAAISG